MVIKILLHGVIWCCFTSFNKEFFKLRWHQSRPVCAVFPHSCILLKFEAETSSESALRLGSFGNRVTYSSTKSHVWVARRDRHPQIQSLAYTCEYTWPNTLDRWYAHALKSIKVPSLKHMAGGGGGASSGYISLSTPSVEINGNVACASTVPDHKDVHFSLCQPQSNIVSKQMRGHWIKKIISDKEEDEDDLAKDCLQPGVWTSLVARPWGDTHIDIRNLLPTFTWKPRSIRVGFRGRGAQV